MLAFTELHQLLVERFGTEAITQALPDALDPAFHVDGKGLVGICQFLHDDARCQYDHLNDLTVVDYFEPDAKKAARFPFEPHLEVVYHLSSFAHRGRLVLKVDLPRYSAAVPEQVPEVPSVTSIWESANWHEREAYDLFGVRFTGHPNLVRILMPEDWPGHPLSKDYVWPDEYHGIRTQ